MVVEITPALIRNVGSQKLRLIVSSVYSFPMNRKLCMLFVLSLILTASCHSNEKEWKSLFDGKTLSGWTIDNVTDTRCYVEEDAIVGEITRTMYYLRSESKYDDFILELEFKVDSGVNSGVQLRSDFLTEDKKCVYTSGGQDLRKSERLFKAGEFCGYQIEIETSERSWCGGFYEQGGRGWLQPMNSDQPSRKAFKQQSWNHLRIIAEKDHFRSWLNGAAATDYYDGNSASGFIGFQFHDSRDEKILGSKIRFRNIRIKEL